MATKGTKNSSNKNKYEIVIKIKEGDASYAENLSASTGNQRVPDYAGNLSKMIVGKTLEAGLSRVLNFAVSNVQLITGSTEIQQKVNFAMQLANYGVQTMSNVATATTFATGAGLSSGAGVAIGIGISIAQIGMNYVEKKAQLTINQIIENRRMEQLRSRAGYSFNKSRMGAE